MVEDSALRQLAAVESSIGEAVYGLDRHGRCTFISTAAAEILGYTCDELLGQNLHERIHHNDPAGSPYPLRTCALCRVLHTGDKGCTTDALVWRRDGTALRVDYVARPLLQDGVLIGAVVTLTTERRRADSALAHLAAIVESSHDAIIGKTLDGIIVSWNHGAERLYGYAADEVIGRSIELLMPPGCVRDLPRIRERLKRGECIAPYETVRVRKDGRRIAVAVSHSPIKDAAGTVTGAATIARDLTARKEAEEALRRSDQRFRFLLLRAYQVLEQRMAERTGALSALYEVTAVASASRDLATILDHALDRIVAVLESEAATIHLVQGTPAVLRLAAARGLPAAVPAQGDPVLRAPQLGRALLRRRHPLVVPDMAGDRRTVHASDVYPSHTYAGVPIRAKGQTLGVLSVLRDRGRQFTADDASLLVATGDQLGVAVAHARLFAEVQNKAALEERQRLAHDLHDSVTQSLYSLTLLAEAARRVVGTDQRHHVAEYVTRLGEAAQQALKEMRLLLYELRPLALQREGLVGAVQQRLDAVEKRAGVETRLLVEGRLTLPAPAEVELYHIIQEALNNAMKHAAARSVTVRIRAEGARVEVTVMDNGRGFDPHGAGDTGGLGLLSMRARVARLGGALTIRSQPGEGTTVTVAVRVDSREASHAIA
jgi:PAS domain S-box-containing protein